MMHESCHVGAPSTWVGALSGYVGAPLPELNHFRVGAMPTTSVTLSRDHPTRFLTEPIVAYRDGDGKAYGGSPLPEPKYVQVMLTVGATPAAMELTDGGVPPDE